MRAAACARASVSGVTIGLIDNIQGNRMKRFRQSRGDSLLHSHG
jgi:hypothetical protein